MSTIPVVNSTTNPDFVCGYCKKNDAHQRCSHCISQVYCGKECEAADWPKHKQVCQLQNGEQKGLLSTLQGQVGGVISAIKNKFLTFRTFLEANALLTKGVEFYNKDKYVESTFYYLKALQIGLSTNDVLVIIKACANLGISYLRLGNFLDVIYFSEVGLAYTSKIKEPQIERMILQNMTHAYFSIGNNEKAAEFAEKEFSAAEKSNDQEKREKVIIFLRYIYWALRKAYLEAYDFRKALNYSTKAIEMGDKFDDIELKIGSRLDIAAACYRLGDFTATIKWSREALEKLPLDPCKVSMIFFQRNDFVEGTIGDFHFRATAFNNIALGLNGLGRYEEAIRNCQEGLNILKQKPIPEIAENLLLNLGVSYEALGGWARAIDYYNQSLDLAKKIPDKRHEGLVYGNLGVVYLDLKDYDKAIDLLLKSLEIAQETSDPTGIEKALANLALLHILARMYNKGIDLCRQGIEITKQLQDKASQLRILVSLGVVYYYAGNYPKALETFKEALNALPESNDALTEGYIYLYLGLVYKKIKDFKNSEINLEKSIEIFSNLQDHLSDSDQSKITIFERLIVAYTKLEELYITQKKQDAALGISDTRRCRALVSRISRKLESKNAENRSLTPSEMQNLASKLNTTFIHYSIQKNNKVIVRVIPPSSKKIEEIEISLEGLPIEVQQVNKLLKTLPYINIPTRESVVPESLFFKEMDELYRGGLNQPSPKREDFKKRLRSCYDVLIAPLRKFIDNLDAEQSLTIIPDGSLSFLPFAAFRNENGQYLIEEHPVVIAPSIKVLHLLDQLPLDSSSISLLIGNPTTPNPKDELKLSETEVQQFVAPFFQTPPDHILVQEAATVARVLEHLPKAKWVHLACHGETDKRTERFSVFEGLFKLAYDQNDNQHSEGHFYAQEIASLSLKAEFIFLSACFSGRGNLQKEGIIGPVWSFHAAGVRSLIATHWRLPESPLTLEIVKTFYSHYIEKKNSKAVALQKALQVAIDKQREYPDLWASLFLSGLSQ